MKLFIDNVPNLVVRAIIASRLPSMFCPKSVFAMDAEPREQDRGGDGEKEIA